MDKRIKKTIEFWAENKYQEAYQCIENLLSDNPNHIVALGLMGNILDEEALKNADNQNVLFDKARLCYEKVLKLSPKHIQANIDLGDYWKRKKDYKKALQLYNKSIQLICMSGEDDLKDDLKDVYCEKILLLEEIGDIKRLMVSLEKAVELFPDSKLLISLHKKYKNYQS